MPVFQMIIAKEMEYPLLCIGVRHDYDPKRLKLDLVNLNSSASWFSDDFGDGTETVINRYERLSLVCVRQVDIDTILVCYDSKFVHFCILSCLLFTFGLIRLSFVLFLTQT